MSTLEELKKQALDATQQNRIQQPGSEDDLREKWRKLSPVMKYLHDHFKELADSLNVLGKEIPIDFKINNSVILRGLKAQNYRITHPSEDKEKEFIFEFENAGEIPTYTNILNGSPATKFKESMDKYRVKYTAKRSDDNKSIKFEIKPLVRTTYLFSADVENETINLTISNYNEMYGRTNKFKRKEITTALMDELTKHVLRNANKYDEMVGNVASEEVRTQIREKLKTQLNAQASTTQEITPQPQQPANKEKSLIGKLFKK